MKAEIISVGTELLLGQVVNSDTALVARELAAMGFTVRYTCVVGDNARRLRETLGMAFAHSDLVVTTGGLGPTDDDLTKETCAAVAGRKLVLDAASKQQIEAYFAGRECGPSQLRQAMLPQGCTVFPNHHGTAPGCGFTTPEGKVLVMLPGPPRELAPMLYESALPYLRQWAQGSIASINVRVFGMGEGSVGERISDLMQGENPTVATYALEDEMYVRVTALADTQAAARALCAPAVAQVQARIGDFVYGVDVQDLETETVAALLRQGKTVATAESCTGGLLAQRLTAVPGASGALHLGLVTYCNEMKTALLGVDAGLLAQRGAVSPEVARAMASAARRKAGADFGIGITGVAGPEPSEGKPVGLIYISLDDGRRQYLRTMPGQGGRRERGYLRHLASSNALDMLLRLLQGRGGVERSAFVRAAEREGARNT